jgi:hypothetical protein
LESAVLVDVLICPGFAEPIGDALAETEAVSERHRHILAAAT